MRFPNLLDDVERALAEGLPDGIEEDEDDVLDIVAYDEELYITLDHYQEDERDESENPDNVDEKKASETETNQVRQIKNSEKIEDKVEH